MNNILNYLFPWDIDYTQACTTPIAKIKTPRVNIHQISIYHCNDKFKHQVELFTCRTNWKPSSQSCCSSTTTSYLAADSAERGVQAHGSRYDGGFRMFRCRKEARHGGFHCARVASEVDISPRQSPYQESDLSAQFQMSEPSQEALQYSIQHPQQRKDNPTVWELVQQST